MKQKSLFGIAFLSYLITILIYLSTFLVLSAQPINGISFCAPASPDLNIEMFEDLKTTNANWVALIPEATLHRRSLRLVPDHENECWGETIDANIAAIKLAKNAGLKIFLKPHLVLGKIEHGDKTNHSEWRGDLRLKYDSDWKVLEQHYETYILELARIAEENEVELFSVGTELKKFTQYRGKFWKQLITKVKNIFHGKITYSANWDEYAHVSFWDDLDYIGVDMYFPVSKSKTPSVQKTIKKWKKISKNIKRTSLKHDRQVLLTEFGYRNISYAGKRPWTHDKGEQTIPNNEAQTNLYEAIFQAFWNEPWVAGGFSWKWFAHPKKKDNTSFTVQGKPALATIKKWYASSI